MRSLLKSGHKLYVVPALRREHRDAYLRMKTLKFKRQMSRQNLYFKGFAMDPGADIQQIEKELHLFFK